MKKLFAKRKREELELAQDPYRNYIRVFWCLP